MLQEQQQQLQQMLGGLADTLKTVTTKIDDQTGASAKAFADQKLLVDGVAEGVRILREKADDTNVRLSTMTQELSRCARRSRRCRAPPQRCRRPAVRPATRRRAGAGHAAPPTHAAGAAAEHLAAANVRQRVQRLHGGQYDLAIEGFEAFIKTLPDVGRGRRCAAEYREFATTRREVQGGGDAFQKVITNYPQSDSVPAAYYKLGLSYERLKQPDLARKAFETVIKSTRPR